MSKSKGNLITPEAYFATVGADALPAVPPLRRAARPTTWTGTSQSDEVIEGCRRFLDRIWRFAVEPRRTRTRRGHARADECRRTRRGRRTGVEACDAPTHRSKVSDDLERWSFNTAVAACMKFANDRLQRYSRSVGGPHGAAWDEAVDSVLLAPCADDTAHDGRGVGAAARRGCSHPLASPGRSPTPPWPRWTGSRWWCR